MARKKNLETFAPWGLLIASILLWQLICAVFDVSEFVFPSPLQIVRSLIEFAVPIAEHAWRTFWTTMVGFAISIVVGVVEVGLVTSTPAFHFQEDSKPARTRMTSNITALRCFASRHGPSVSRTDEYTS